MTAAEFVVAVLAQFEREFGHDTHLLIAVGKTQDFMVGGCCESAGDAMIARLKTGESGHRQDIQALVATLANKEK